MNIRFFFSVFFKPQGFNVALLVHCNCTNKLMQTSNLDLFNISCRLLISVIMTALSVCPFYQVQCL